jgi:teichuronic acid biosynthesis glycosyltransferase TuaH
MEQLTIFYPPAIDYTFLHQRPAQLLKQFARHGYKAIYCNLTQQVLRPDEVEPNLFVYHNAKNAVLRNNIDIFYATNPSHIEWMKENVPYRPKVVIYDLLDYFPAWAKGEAKALPEADIVCAVSQPLVDTYKDKYDVHLVRNACDPSVLNTVKLCKSKEIQRVRDLGKPIVAFVGSVGVWVDTKLIEKIDDEKYSVVVVGCELGNSFPKNSINTGHRQYSEAMAWMDASDVLILPFKNDKISHYANPIKMYEYLLLGKTFVSSDSPEVKTIPYPCALVKNGPSSFVKGIEESMALNKKLEIQQQCIDFAMQNTWEQRFNQIEELIKGCGKL